MPKLTDETMNEYGIHGSNYKFSAKRIDDLGATEYTLGTILVDVSGSVASFKGELRKCLQSIVKACKHNPRADNMMLRVLFFNHKLEEVHGFKPLPDCHESHYENIINPSGTTAMYDAIYNGTEAMVNYGKHLVDQDFDVNGALFLVTDGYENASSVGINTVCDSLSSVITSESLESLMTVLVGVNVSSGSSLNSELQNLQKKANFQQYVPIRDADEQSLARLSNFISQSLSSQSQSLGSGGPSQSLVF